MWFAIFIVLVLVLGCGRIDFDPTAGAVAGRDCGYAGQRYPSGVTFAAGDGCNACTCSDGTVSCTSAPCVDACVTCPDALVLSSCAPSGGCPSGPSCGPTGVCCDRGEQCINDKCVCGGGGTQCVAPDTCQGPGPITDVFQCGTICCHGARCPV